MSNELIIHTTDSNFEQDVLQAEGAVLVDFWAPWCAPCRALAPVLDAVATEYQGKIKIVKLDVQEHQAVATQFGIQSIPALYIFKNGKVVATQLGSVPKSRLESFIDSAL